MKWDAKELDQGFSLRRLLDGNTDPTAIASRKTLPSKKISLSKSRSNSQSSITTDRVIKQEKTLDFHWHLVKAEKNEVKLKEADRMLDINAKHVEIKVEDQDVPMSNVFLNNVKTENETFEIVDIQDTNQLIADATMVNENETHLIQDTNTYNCPVCDKNLSSVTSSYLRQRHVEECLLTNKESPEEALEYENCVFCGKYLQHFNAARRQLHLNRCLDSLGEAEDNERISKPGETYAGQPVPFLNDLEVCPVCFEPAPFVNRQVKQKIVHIKQCSRRNNMCLPELLKKFQWIGWGHLPTPNIPKEEPTPAAAISIPQHECVAFTHEIDEVGSDFSQTIHIHKKRRVENQSKNEDKNDEELQTVLALSRSMKEVESQMRRKEKIRPSDERDWNAANIISMEESRLKAISKLDELLFPAPQTRSIQLEREKSTRTLGPSRIPSLGLFYWSLVSNKEDSWSNPDVFVASFIRDLHK